MARISRSLAAWLVCIAVLLAGCGAPVQALTAASTAASTRQGSAPASTRTPALAATRPALSSESAPGAPGTRPAPSATQVPPAAVAAAVALTPVPPAAPTGFGVIPAVGTVGPGYLPPNLRIFNPGEGVFTDGKTLAWVDGTTLRATRLSDGHEYPPITAPKDTDASSIAGEWVAWIVPDQDPRTCQGGCTRHVVVENFVTGASVPLARTHYDETMAILSGDWLVWQAVDPLPGPPQYHHFPGAQAEKVIVTNTVLARNLRTLAEPIVLRHTTNRLFLRAVDGSRALIAEQEEGTDLAANSILSAVDVATGASQVLVQGEDIDPSFCTMQGGMLLYWTADQATTWTLNVRTGWRKKFPNATEWTTDGRYILWIDRTQAIGTHKYRQDLFGYDAATDTNFLLAANAGVNDYPRVRNGIVLWSHYDHAYGGPTQTYMAVMADLGK